MGSLAAYIRDMQSQGYTDAQIRTALKKTYPQAAIDTAFSAIQGDTILPKTKPRTDALDSYVQTLLSQGYQVEQLKPYLIQQGYTERKVDKAISKATGIQPKAHLPAAISFLFLFAAIAVGATIFFLNQIPAPTTPTTTPAGTLSLSLMAENTILSPGQSTRAEATITNTGLPEDSTILFTLQDTAGHVYWTKEKVRPITAQTATAELVEVPRSAPAGNYLLTVTVQSEQPATETLAFTIRQEGGRPVLPATTSLNPVVVIANEQNLVDAAAIKAQRGDTRGAVLGCEEIVSRSVRDDCYDTLSLTTKNPVFCADINATEKRDNCYMPFILDGSYQYCDELQNEDRKNLCEQLESLNSL